MKYPNTVQSLINVANWLDENGQHKMADAVDHAVKIITAEPMKGGKCCEVCEKPCGENERLCPGCNERLGKMTEEQKKLMKDQNKAN
jgi:hypothetical protein